jgi:hypothetical protein
MKKKCMFCFIASIQLFTPIAPSSAELAIKIWNGVTHRIMNTQWCSSKLLMHRENKIFYIFFYCMCINIQCLLFYKSFKFWIFLWNITWKKRCRYSSNFFSVWIFIWRIIIFCSRTIYYLLFKYTQYRIMYPTYTCQQHQYMILL